MSAILRDDCGRKDCRHGKSSHHKGAHACLAAFCGCDEYVAPGTPEAKPPRPKDHPSFCGCFVCKQWT